MKAWNSIHEEVSYTVDNHSLSDTLGHIFQQTFN